MTKQEMREVYMKAFDLLYKMQEEYLKYLDALKEGEKYDAWEAQDNFEMFLGELKNIEAIENDNT